MNNKGGNSCRTGFGNCQYDRMRTTPQHSAVPEVDNSLMTSQPAHKSPNRVLKILVIDDIMDVAEVLCSLLGHLGHTVTSANNGIEGIEIATEFLPDVLICDIGMPGMNGYEVAKSFRDNNKLRNVFMIALTGYARPDHMERAREAGFDRQLTKPVDLATLRQTLGEVPKA